MRYDPVAEGRQMMVETWRLMRDHFWIEDMGGVDWDDVLERYLPLVDEIATRDDLSEVLWEMIGELGSSHAYERFEFPPPPNGRAAAFLGADLDRDGDGRWVITRVLPSESSVPAARSPLRAAGANVQDGDVLLAVNGRAGRRDRAGAAARRTGRQAGRADDRARRHAAHRGRHPDRGRDADPLPGLGVRTVARPCTTPATDGSATCTCRT